jgi:hypothetical protein
MREVNVSSVRTYRQIGAPATNQRKRISTMFRTRRQPAPAAKTGLMSKVKTWFRTKRQPAPPAKTGLMSKLKTLFSSRKKMTKTTPKAKKPGRRK